jgi:hypothetical protein
VALICLLHWHRSSLRIIKISGVLDIAFSRIRLRSLSPGVDNRAGYLGHGVCAALCSDHFFLPDGSYQLYHQSLGGPPPLAAC